MFGGKIFDLLIEVTTKFGENLVSRILIFGFEFGFGRLTNSARFLPNLNVVQ